MLELRPELFRRPVNLAPPVEADILRGDITVSREIPSRDSRCDIESPADIRPGYFAQKVKPEIDVGEPLPLSPSRRLNVRFQRILSVASG